MAKILIIEFKKKGKGAEAYKTLPAFLDRYPAYKESSLEYYLSRLKQPFEDAKLKITRTELFTREK